MSFSFCSARNVAGGFESAKHVIGQWRIEIIRDADFPIQDAKSNRRPIDRKACKLGHRLAAIPRLIVTEAAARGLERASFHCPTFPIFWFTRSAVKR